MRSDRAGRSFAGILAIGLAPLGLAGLVVCGAMVAPGVSGALDLDGRPAVAVVTLFATVTAIGAGLGARSLGRHWCSSRNLAALVARRGRPSAPRVSRVARAQGLREVDVIVVDDDGSYAYTIGAWRPRIVVSRGLVEAADDAQLGAVLAHERYHVGHRDPLRIVVARAIDAAMFFVPATSALVARYRLARELEADRWAVSRYGRPALAGALLATMKPADTRGAPVAGVGGTEILDVRLAQLEQGSPPPPCPIPRHLVLVSLVGITALAAGGLVSAALVGLPVLAVAAMTDGAVAAGSVVSCAAAVAMAAGWLRTVMVAQPLNADLNWYTTIT